jgi:thiol-disulfide isomerase/thioredoxin
MRHAFLILVVAIATVAEPGLAAEPVRQLALHETPVAVPTISFADEAGAPRSLADFRGKVVLLNIWATWCVPCRTEMSTLDRLQAVLGGPDFEVVALSIDRGGPEVVRRFFDEIGIQHLAVNIDTTTGAAFELGAVGLPATLLIDRDGMEVGRVIGPAEWDSEEMVSALKTLIADEPAQLQGEENP